MSGHQFSSKLILLSILGITSWPHSSNMTAYAISISVRATDSDYERLATATVMQKPFPALTSLYLLSYPYRHTPVLPDTSLGGSAPRLRSLTLTSVPFPTFFVCNDLSELSLRYMPDFGHISLEAKV
jgi:hypothetical protein